MKTKEYRKLDKKELKSKIADLTIMIMQTGKYGIKKIDPVLRKNFRKEIARIKTELNRRKNLNSLNKMSSETNQTNTK